MTKQGQDTLIDAALETYQSQLALSIHQAESFCRVSDYQDPDEVLALSEFRDRYEAVSRLRQQRNLQAMESTPLLDVYRLDNEIAELQAHVAEAAFGEASDA